MNLTSDCWKILSTLQRSLKKQFLLVEKQQQQKIKLKRQIEDLVRSFHSHSIELYSPGGQLLKDQGFDNCYNFIKDVVITVSSDYRLGKLILFLAQENTSLPALIMHGLYENIETSDIFTKQITRLMFSLLTDLSSGDLSIGHQQKIIEAWKLFMQRINIQAYFQQIAQNTLKVLLRNNQAVSVSPTKRKNKSPEKQNLHFSRKRPLSIVAYDELVANYLDKIEAEALLCPPSMKIALKTLSQHEKTHDKVWKLVSHFYLVPFLRISSKSELHPESRQRILHFVDELVQNWNFNSELTHHSFQSESSYKEEASKRIEKICNKILDVNEDRWKLFVTGDVVADNSKIHIKILGGCLSLVQLYELLIMIQTHQEEFSKISEKVTNRTLKVFQISPKLQILRREKPGLLFASLSEFRYQESIDSDYYKNYSLVYRGQTLKQMLKQVLVQIENLSSFKTAQRNTLSLLFQSLADQEDKNHIGVGISAQLLMKVKYLIHLLARQKNHIQEQIMEEMLKDLEQRNSVNFKLFENTKFSLLKVYCNLRNIKHQVKTQKDASKKAQSRITLIKKLQEHRLNICITSKASRNKSEMQNQDKYKYRISTADEILVMSTSECIHKENTFTGRQSHPNSISKFIQVFSELEEVKYYLKRPSFLEQFQEQNPFLYCNQTRIGQAIEGFISALCQQLSLTHTERSVIQDVIFRALSEQMLGNKQMPISSFYDRCLNQTAFAEGVKDSESPRKRTSELPRKGSFQQEQLSNEVLSSGMHEEQLLTMGKRYLCDLLELHTPSEKMRRLRDVMDIYRIAVGGQGKVDETLLQKLITRTIVLSKMPNLSSQFAFLEMFLPDKNLMSTDGKVLKDFQKCAIKIIGEMPSRELSLKEGKTFSSPMKN